MCLISQVCKCIEILRRILGYTIYLSCVYIINDDMPLGAILDHSFRRDDGIVYLFSLGQPHLNVITITIKGRNTSVN